MNIINRKSVTLAAAAAMAALMLSACGSEPKFEGDSSVSSGTAAQQTEAQSNTSGTSGSQQSGQSGTQKTQKDSGSSGAQVKQISIDDVAAYNGCKVNELNAVDDAEGYVQFLGAPFTDTKVKNEEDALDVLLSVADMAGIGDSYLDFYRVDDSTATGLIYYTFYQTDTAMIDGEMVPAKFYGNLIKLITDKDGNVQGYSSFLNHSGTKDNDEDAFLTASEAEQVVSTYLEGNAHIFSDYTSFFYWDDEGTAAGAGKVVPVWAVYTENVSEKAKTPYQIYLVNALYQDYENARYYSDCIADVIDATSLSQMSDMDGEYTSELFFAGMEDAGTYTYTLDMKWVKKLDQGYKADDPFTVTVPVMYDPQEKLYYLADYTERIAAANYYDFEYYNTVNPVVSTDPSDKSSWHFADMTGPEGEKYFCDPNYIISSYDAMEKAYGCFKERYGFNSVDKTGMPCILLTYYTDSYTYPTDAEMFERNAVNCGQIRDWNVTATSPAAAFSVEIGTLTHEFTHGINGQLTNSQYKNQQGAVMEGYADSIGELIAYIYGYKWDEFVWEVGSQFSAPIRSFRDPEKYDGAKYIGGINYVSPVYSAKLAKETDCGGVHTDSGVVNYLCYSMSNSELVDKSALLTLEENLDCWFETMYLTTYDTDFMDIAHFLIFAADHMPGLAKEKADTVRYLTNVLGFTGRTDKLNELIEAEGGYVYGLKLNIPEHAGLDDYEFCADFGSDDGSVEYTAGEIDSDGAVYFRTAERTKDPCWALTMASDNDYAGSETVIISAADDGELLSMDVDAYILDEDSTFNTDGGMIFDASYVYLLSEEELEEDPTEVEDYVKNYLSDYLGDTYCKLPAEGRYFIYYMTADYERKLAVVTVE